MELQIKVDIAIAIEVITVFVQKHSAVSLIFVFIIALDLTGQSLIAKSGLSAEMGKNPQKVVIDGSKVTIRLSIQ